MPPAFLQALKREMTDHASFILDTGSHIVTQPIFRFETSRMWREGFKYFVTNVSLRKYDGSAIENGCKNV